MKLCYHYKTLINKKHIPVLEHWQSPITESPPSIDINGVKRNLDKKQWCVPQWVHTVPVNTEVYGRSDAQS